MVRAIPDGVRDGAAGQVAPHPWALSLWARAFRRLGRPWLIKRHANRFCSPLRVEGAEHFSAVRSPALIVANHTSHLDSLIVLAVLPPTLYNRVAITAAADRFYTSPLKSAWFSLRYNAYPITRGGGSRALAYSESLLEGGWSLLIFPEGKRSRTEELLPFHPGPAILAIRQNVPVLPLYIAGAAESLRPGTRWAQPAPVTVHVGRPLLIDPTSSVAEATAAIEEAVSQLGRRRTFAAAA